MPVRVDIDDGAFGHGLGMVAGVADTVSTNKYISDVVRFASNRAAAETARLIDAAARSVNNLSHVYEFRLITKRGRLFKPMVTGTGAHRVVSFTFLQSQRRNMTLRQRLNRGGYALTRSDPVFKGDNAVQLDKSYIFRRKATLLEYGGSATVRPIGDHPKIFYPLRRPYVDDQGRVRKYVFTEMSNVKFDNQRHLGQFTAAWKIASLQGAEKAQMDVEKSIERGARTVGIRAGKNARKKSYSVAFTDGKREGETLMEAAKEEMMFDDDSL